MKFSKLVCLTAGVLLSGTFALSANADTVIYNNFAANPPSIGSFDTSTPNQYWRVESNGVSAAMPFTPNGNFTLSQITLAISNIDSSPTALVTLNASSSGAPGALLEQWTLSPIFQYWYPCCGFPAYTPETLISSPGVHLNSGQQYWITVNGDTNSSTDAAWNLNSTNDIGLVAYTAAYSTTGWNTTTGTRGAYEVLGVAAVPEPKSYAMLLAGLGLMGFMVRRKKFA